MRQVPCNEGLGVLETPMPRLILIAPTVANGIREIVAEFSGVLSEPGVCSGLVEVNFERTAGRI